MQNKDFFSGVLLGVVIGQAGVSVLYPGGRTVSSRRDNAAAFPSADDLDMTLKYCHFISPLNTFSFNMPIPGIRENRFLWRGRFCILIVTGKVLSNNLRGVEDHEWRLDFRRQGEPARPD